MKIPTADDIRDAAKAKGLSIAAMCRRADSDSTAFYHYASGKGAPNIATLQKWLDVIAATPDPPNE